LSLTTCNVCNRSELKRAHLKIEWSLLLLHIATFLISKTFSCIYSIWPEQSINKLKSVGIPFLFDISSFNKNKCNIFLLNFSKSTRYFELLEQKSSSLRLVLVFICSSSKHNSSLRLTFAEKYHICEVGSALFKFCIFLNCSIFVPKTATQ